jgi:hypothetical protein
MRGRFGASDETKIHEIKKPPVGRFLLITFANLSCVRI